ncbi:MAG TPA: SAM-dependent chlorinase/fluorinase [Vicinamibacteria bacterium]
MRPVVALLTDFGTEDHYVGAVKGAILTVCPDVNLVDVVHGLPPHDVVAGAFALAAAYRFFPAGTVFLAVVDPGVGSPRRALALEAAGYRFVGPDNGLFTFLLRDARPARVHEITNAGLFRFEVSATFHARDVFGPVAGHLARGLALEDVGPALAEPVLLRDEPTRRLGPEEWQTSVLHVDRFGNLITHLHRDELRSILAELEEDLLGMAAVVEGIVVPLARTYADVPEGEACALVGGSGRLEVAVNRGNASRLLGASRGAPIRLRRALPAGESGPMA